MLLVLGLFALLAFVVAAELHSTASGLSYDNYSFPAAQQREQVTLIKLFTKLLAQVAACPCILFKSQELNASHPTKGTRNNEMTILKSQPTKSPLPPLSCAIKECCKNIGQSKYFVEHYIMSLLTSE